MGIYDRYMKAVQEGDRETASRLQSMIVNGCYDESLDEAFIRNIRGKKVYDNLLRLMGDNLSLSDSVKLAASLITHYVIEADQCGKSYAEYPITVLHSLLGSLIRKDSDAMVRFTDFAREHYAEYI